MLNKTYDLKRIGRLGGPPPAPRLGGPQSVRMRENQGKMRTRITPNTDSFYAAHFSKKTETGK